MKALIIGGTRGVGREISTQFEKNSYALITVGRSARGYKNYPHYLCDVGDLYSLRKTIRNIASHQKTVDALVCVVGFARAKPFAELTIDNWQETFTKNVFYVAVALQELAGLLSKSKDPRVLTIGSQWSYKTGCDELVPYTVAKHALRTLSKDFAERNPTIKVNHYCVPTMDTPEYREVKKSFQKIAREKAITSFTSKGLADKRLIAKAVVNSFLATNISGSMFVLGPSGMIRELN